MISRSKRVISSFVPPRNGSTIPSSVRNPDLTLLSSRIQRRFNLFAALARLYRAGELTPVWVPDRTHEALRDLVRTRQAATKDLRAARHRLDKFLLRNGMRKPMPMSSWTQKHMAWIKSLDFQEKLQKVVFEDYLHQVEHQGQRTQDLEKAIDKSGTAR